MLTKHAIICTMLAHEGQCDGLTMFCLISLCCPRYDTLLWYPNYSFSWFFLFSGGWVEDMVEDDGETEACIHMYSVKPVLLQATWRQSWRGRRTSAATQHLGPRPPPPPPTRWQSANHIKSRKYLSTFQTSLYNQCSSGDLQLSIPTMLRVYFLFYWFHKRNWQFQAEDHCCIVMQLENTLTIYLF